MNSVRHAQIKDLFEAACLEPASERFNFLARTCGEDDAMRREIESLLAFYDDPTPTDKNVRRSRRLDHGLTRLRRGTVVGGRYRIEHPLGAGGMGEVYAVYDGLLRHKVALKILPHADSQQRRRLIEEVRLARQVTHPGVCRVYDLGEDAGMTFITMELIEGRNLAIRLSRSGALPSSEVANIGHQLSAALAAAHEAGVLHRDLKPSNILTSRDGRVYIVDFGIATSHDRTGAAGKEDAHRFGTPAYMAPEQSVPGGVATQQTDLYSLGLVLYELLTGVAAFDAPDIETLLERQRSTAPEPPSRIVPEVDRDLETLVLQLLAKDPARRPESALAVLAALSSARQAPSQTVAASTWSERRQVVFLVCALAAPPEVGADRRWPEVVRMFQARCSASCRLRGGRIDRHLPRGLLVHFGLPLAGEQDAERAVEAGLEIVAEARERPLLASGVGLPSVIADALPAIVRGGRVILAKDQLDAMTRAASTIGEEAEGEVIVTDALRTRLRGAFVTMVLPGAQRAAFYRVSRARKRLGLGSGGGRLTPFTGRELELARLEQWWRAASSGRGQVVMISGEAGLGKSRIARELWQRVRGEALGYEARCSSLHSNTPLFPFVGMMAQIARLEPDDDRPTRAAKLRRALTPLGPRGDQLIPLFSAWLFPDLKATPTFGSTTETDRRAAVAAIEECLLLLADTRPVVLLCEDIHWSDPTTREAIDRLVNLVRTARVLLVLTFRPDFVPPWRGSGINHLALQPLRLEEARAMVAALPTQRAENIDSLIARADGNPLFLEELARHADDSRAPLTASSVPVSLRDLLSARLDRLGAAKHLAQVAAVCGRTVSYPLLAALCEGEGDSSDTFDLSLTNLLDSEIFEQRGLRHSATFTFRHALLRESAYGSLSPRDRRRTHELVADALPALEPDTVALHPELLAAHFADAGRLDRAFEWSRRAGLLMLERSAYAESEYHLTQALRALRRKARGAERRRQELELRSALTALEMGRHGPASVPAARCAHKAQALCVGLEIDDGVARALMLSARVLFANGKLRATWRMLAPLRAYMDSIRDPYLRASVLTQAGNLMSSLGRLDEAEGLQDRAMAAYAEAREHPAGALTTDPLAHLLITRAGNDWLRGRAAASRRWVDAAIAETERLGHPFSRAMIRVLSASLALRQGDQARFAELSEEGRRQAAAIGSNWLMSMADVFIPLADESLAPAKRAQRLQAALTVHPGTWLYRSVPMSELADLLASAGRPDDALQAMNEAVTEAKRRDLCLAPEILRRRGELLARLGRTVEAEADHRRGLRAARREGAFGLELRCVLSLARLLSANGREVAARRALESVLARLPADVDVPERAEAASMSAALGRPPVSP